MGARISGVRPYLPDGGTPLNNPLIDFCALLHKSKLHS